MSDKLISVRQLAKRFGENIVLRGIDFEVARGEIVGIIGPSGSGKSTLLRCLNFLEVANGGELLFEGKAVGHRKGRSGEIIPDSEANLSVLRTQIGMVFQNFNLFPHMTVLQNVMEGPVIVKGIPKAVALQEAIELLERVGLSDKVSSYPSTLSGGQQQRAAIARALAMKPKVMLFDEPTSSLDPELVGEVLEVMKSLVRDGMTMLIATHEMTFIQEIAHRVVFIDAGMVVESGTPEQVFGNPTQSRTVEFLKRVRVRK